MGRAALWRREGRAQTRPSTSSRQRCTSDDLDPAAVQVELYADGIDGGGPVRQEMARTASPAGAPQQGIYRASVPTARPAANFTARIIPRWAGVAVPLEADFILWQR